MAIEYMKVDFRGLEEIRPMWDKLISLRKRMSSDFRENDGHMTSEKRLKSFTDKAVDGKLAVFFAKNTASEEYVGYCVCIIDKCATGEVESLFVSPIYSGENIKDELFTLAINWLDDNGAIDKILSVAAGEEYSMSFYAKYGFKPIRHILKWKQ